MCSVPWGEGVLSTVGDIMSNVGDIMSNVGDIMCTVGGYLVSRGGHLEYCGGCSVPLGISWYMWGTSLSTLGDIIFCNLSTVGNIMIHVGDVVSTVGGLVPWKYSNNKTFILHGTNGPPTVLMVLPRYWVSPTVDNFVGTVSKQNRETMAIVTTLAITSPIFVT